MNAPVSPDSSQKFFRHRAQAFWNWYKHQPPSIQLGILLIGILLLFFMLRPLAGSSKLNALERDLRLLEELGEHVDFVQINAFEFVHEQAKMLHGLDRQ